MDIQKTYNLVRLLLKQVRYYALEGFWCQRLIDQMRRTDAPRSYRFQTIRSEPKGIGKCLNPPRGLSIIRFEHSPMVSVKTRLKESAPLARNVWPYIENRVRDSL